MRLLNIVLTVIACAATSASAQTACASRPAAFAGRDSLDRIVRDRRYPELVQWAAAHPAAYVRGILANRRNQNRESMRLLEPLVGHLDTARTHVVLKTLADDYVKTYRYGAAADVLGRLQHAGGVVMDTAELADVRNDAALFDALRTAPPQRVADSRPFAVSVRRDSLDLLEAQIGVGSDVSWWIIDTGANFTTVTESMAHRLGLHVSQGSAQTKGMTGTSVPLRVAIIPELRLGPARVTNVVALVLADSALSIATAPPFQISAILGYPVLEALDRIAIGHDSLWVTPHPRGTPTQRSNLFLEQLGPTIVASVDGSAALYHFDSGAASSNLGVDFCAAYPQRVAVAAHQAIEVAGAGGATVFQGYELTDLPMTIGSRTVTLDSVPVYAEVTHASFEPFFGNLGQDITRQFGGWTIDFRAMTFDLGVNVSAIFDNRTQLK